MGIGGSVGAGSSLLSSLLGGMGLVTQMPPSKVKSLVMKPSTLTMILGGEGLALREGAGEDVRVRGRNVAGAGDSADGHFKVEIDDLVAQFLFGGERSDCNFWGMLGFDGGFVQWGKWRDMDRKFPL